MDHIDLRNRNFNPASPCLPAGRLAFQLVRRSFNEGGRLGSLLSMVFALRFASRPSQKPSREVKIFCFVSQCGLGIKKINTQRGIAAITSILIIVILTLLISFAASTSGITEGVVSKYQYQAGQAYAAAESGAQDAMIRIARDKNYYTRDTPPGYYLIPSGCSLNSSTKCTKVIIERNTGYLCSQSISSGAGYDQDCVISTGTLQSKSKTVEVILNVNATSGKIEIVSWREI